VSKGGALNDPLGLAIRSDNGDVLTCSGNDGLLVDTITDGRQVAKLLLDNTCTPPGAGTLFGLEDPPAGVIFVDDGSNTLNFVVNPPNTSRSS
jgi:hypothetical protein